MMNSKRSYHLTVVRHGETFENRQGIIQGQMDVPLSPRGLEQASLLGTRLVKAGRRFTHIFSSDLLRARQTAETALSSEGGERLWRGVEICQDCRLRERCYGSGEGKSRSELAREAKSMGIRPDEYLPVGAETDRQLMIRAESFFTEINSVACDLLFSAGLDPSVASADCDAARCNVEAPRVLVFSHGGWILNLLLYIKYNLPFTNKSQQKGPLVRTPPNTGVCEFVVDVRKDSAMPVLVSCHNVHDATHLDTESDG